MCGVISCLLGMGLLLISVSASIAEVVSDQVNSVIAAESGKSDPTPAVRPGVSASQKSSAVSKRAKLTPATSRKESNRTAAGSRSQRPNAKIVPASAPRSGSDSTRMASTPASIGPGRTDLSPEPKESPVTGEASLTSSTNGYSHLEIWVSHSQHELKLLGNTPAGTRDVLYEARVGLGNPREFPTPVGVYFVRQIYDDHPWWIPPKNRAWAAGDSPSRKVYGGTMAPLLKKRPASTKNSPPHGDDFIDPKVRLDDDGYRFHGTNQLRSIGQNQSHGCVRMRPEDAKEVALLIKEHVGAVDRREDENGTYFILRSPVRLNLVK